MDQRRRSSAVPGLPWLALESDRAPCAPPRAHYRSFYRALGRRSATAYREAAFSGEPENRGGRSRAGNFATAAVHAKRWARLSGARAFGENIERRRIAADPFGGPARLESARRSLCSRRADDRPSSARQRAPARNADRVAAKGKFARDRRAR